MSDEWRKRPMTIVSRDFPNRCEICHQEIIREAHGGPHPSPGDHDPAYHVAKAYGTTHPSLTEETR